MNRRPVMLVREEWRVVDRWWTDDPVSRRYFDLVLEGGERSVVFHDLEQGGWLARQRGSVVARHEAASGARMFSSHARPPRCC